MTPAEFESKLLEIHAKTPFVVMYYSYSTTEKKIRIPSTDTCPLSALMGQEGVCDLHFASHKLGIPLKAVVNIAWQGADGYHEYWQQKLAKLLNLNLSVIYDPATGTSH